MNSQVIKDLIDTWAKYGFNHVRFDECRIGLCWDRSISIILRPRTFFENDYMQFDHDKFKTDVITKLRSLTDMNIDINVWDDIGEFEISW